MIEVRNLICEFPDGDGRVIRALDVPSFTLEDGGAMALIGPSGSGKTTLLHCLSGLMTPTKGTVIVSGADLTQITRQEKCRFRAQKVGYVFQKSLILPYLTVAENIRLSARLAGWDLMQDELDGLLESVGLFGKGNRRPEHLSGGEQQRVSFLRAVARHPSLLLADEPTSGLDRENGKILMNLMLDYQRRTKCMLLCATHDPEVQALFENQYFMKRGNA